MIGPWAVLPIHLPRGGLGFFLSFQRSSSGPQQINSRLVRSSSLG